MLYQRNKSYQECMFFVIKKMHYILVSLAGLMEALIDEFDKRDVSLAYHSNHCGYKLFIDAM